jgi:hypothetical protein
MAANPYDDTAAALFSGQLAVGARASVAQVADRDPDAEAERQRHARLLNIPYDSARAHPQLVDQQLAPRQVDYDHLARTAPRTARFLSSTSNAAIAHDDVSVLGRIEQGLRYALNPVSLASDIAARGAQQVGASTAQEVQQKGGTAGYLSAVGRDVSPSSIGRHTVSGGLKLVSGLLGTVEGSQEGAEKVDVTAGMQRRLFGDTLESGLAGLSRAARRKVDQAAYAIAPTPPETTVGAGVQSGIESLPLTAGALATTIFTDNPFAGLAMIGGTQFGQSYGQARDVGVGVGRATAKSAIDAAVEMGTEYLPEKWFLADRHAGSTFAQMLLDQVKSEVPGEQVATLVEDFNQWAMIDQNQGKSFHDYVQQIVPDALQTLIATGVGLGAPAAIGAVGKGLGRLTRVEARAGQAQAAAQHIEDLNKLAASSALRERAPATFQALVDDMADGSPAETVYVAPDTLAGALMQSGFDEEHAKAVDNSLGPRIKEAVEQGTDVAVPVSEFTTLLAGTPAEKALLDHVKVDPNGMTRAEAEEFMTTKGEALKAEIEQELSRATQDEAHRSEVDQVKARVLEQLAAANRFTAQVNERYADLHAAFYGTLARRLGVSPNTLYERFPIRILNRAMPDSHDLLHQRFTDLMASFGKAPKPGKLANDNSDVPGALGPFAERIGELRPLHHEYRKGDFLRFQGETGKVVAANKKAVTLALPSGPQIVSRDHADLAVAPWQEWKADDELHQSDEAPIFYSELERAIEASKQAKASPEQWLATISKTAGVKKEEIEWTELPEWLATQDGPVTREELLAFVRAGGVQVEEVDRGAASDVYHSAQTDEGDYGVYNSDYELIATFDDPEAADEYANELQGDAGGATQFESYTEEGGEDYHELLLTLPPGVGGNPERAPSTHFDDPGVVAHLRFKTRATTDGEKLLFIEEVQSDWHQKGRDQGYAVPKTPEEMRDIQDRFAAANDRVNEAGRDIVEQARNALDREIAARKDAVEPPMPEVGADMKIWLDRIVEDALRGSASLLRASTPALENNIEVEKQHKDTARGEEYAKLLEYAKAQIALIERSEMERARSDLDGGVLLTAGRQAAQINRAYELGLDDTEWRAAELRQNEVRQELENAVHERGIPDAPFKATWPALAMKRAIRWAVDNGFEAVAWTTGEQQRERYNLADSVGEIKARKVAEGEYVVELFESRMEGTIADRGLARHESDGLHMTPEQIGEVFGKDLGSRMMALADQNPNPDLMVKLNGDDLKIGGEGMLAFYDRNLVNITNNILKKLGGSKVEMVPVVGMGKAEEALHAHREQWQRMFTEARAALGPSQNIAGMWGTAEIDKRIDAISPQRIEAAIEEQEYAIAENAKAQPAEGVDPEQFFRAIEGMTEERRQKVAKLKEAAAPGGSFEQRRAELAQWRPHLEEAERLMNTKPEVPGSNPGFVVTPEIAAHAREGFALFQKNRGAYSPATDTISLLEHADLSTFLHESGHFFLETYSRLVEQGNAPQQINDDFAAFLKWAGIKDVAEWHAMGLEQRREAHEKFARGFEAYLFTGRAPAPRLRELFRTFRSWLIAVYKHVRNLGVAPTESIRKVMDRMLASDEEIADAQAARSMEPLFKDQASSGMSEDQWRDYQRTNATATEEARQQLTSRSLRDLQWLDNARSKEINRLKRQADAVRKSMRARVAAEVAQEPVYRAQQYLKRGAPRRRDRRRAAQAVDRERRQGARRQPKRRRDQAQARLRQVRHPRRRRAGRRRHRAGVRLHQRRPSHHCADHRRTAEREDRRAHRAAAARGARRPH